MNEQKRCLSFGCEEDHLSVEWSVAAKRSRCATNEDDGDSNFTAPTMASSSLSSDYSSSSSYSSLPPSKLAPLNKRCHQKTVMVQQKPATIISTPKLVSEETSASNSRNGASQQNRSQPIQIEPIQEVKIPKELRDHCSAGSYWMTPTTKKRRRSCDVSHRTTTPSLDGLVVSEASKSRRTGSRTRSGSSINTDMKTLVREIDDGTRPNSDDCSDANSNANSNANSDASSDANKVKIIGIPKQFSNNVSNVVGETKANVDSSTKTTLSNPPPNTNDNICQWDKQQRVGNNNNFVSSQLKALQDHCREGRYWAEPSQRRRQRRRDVCPKKHTYAEAGLGKRTRQSAFANSNEVAHCREYNNKNNRINLDNSNDRADTNTNADINNGRRLGITQNQNIEKVTRPEHNNKNNRINLHNSNDSADANINDGKRLGITQNQNIDQNIEKEEVTRPEHNNKNNHINLDNSNERADTNINRNINNGKRLGITHDQNHDQNVEKEEVTRPEHNNKNNHINLHNSNDRADTNVNNGKGLVITHNQNHDQNLDKEKVTSPSPHEIRNAVCDNACVDNTTKKSLSTNHLHNSNDRADENINNGKGLGITHNQNLEKEEVTHPLPRIRNEIRNAACDNACVNNTTKKSLSTNDDVPRDNSTESSQQRIVFRAVEGSNQPINRYTLDLISLVCNNFYNITQQDRSKHSLLAYQQVHRILDHPLFGHTIETESEKERLMRLQFRQRFASATSIGISPVVFAKKLLGLWGGILEETVPTENAESRVGTIEERHQPEHKAKTICKQRKKRETKKKDPKKSCRWELWEHLEFLRGLRVHGKGHWQEIAENIPTRTTVQVKSHGQVILRKQKKGINIFEPLDNPNCDDKTHPPPPMM